MNLQPSSAIKALARSPSPGGCTVEVTCRASTPGPRTSTQVFRRNELSTPPEKATATDPAPFMIDRSLSNFSTRLFGGFPPSTMIFKYNSSYVCPRLSVCASKHRPIYVKTASKNLPPLRRFKTTSGRKHVFTNSATNRSVPANTISFPLSTSSTFQQFHGPWVHWIAGRWAPSCHSLLSDRFSIRHN